MPLFLRAILTQLIAAGLAAGSALREIRQRVSARYLLSMEQQIPANDFRNLYANVQRQVSLGETLMAGGGTNRVPARAPGCPELGGGAPSYHASVFLDVYTPGGTYQGRIRTDVDFGTRLTGNEVMDLAVQRANTAIMRGESVGGTTAAGSFGVRSRVDASSASIGTVCYG